MAEPKWLTRDEIDFIHQHAIDMAGGSRGLRDAGLLDSALARPRNLHAYGEEDTFQLAASYAEAISQNHPFVDGNKRVAFGAATIFLRNSGFDLLPSRGDEHADMIERLAQSKITRDEAVRHFKEYARTRERVREGCTKAVNREGALMAKDEPRPGKKDWGQGGLGEKPLKPLPPRKKGRDR